MPKIAIITQSYINDICECRLLCESIDLFAPNIDHFIFVNDEDYDLFQSLNYNNHRIYKKGTILPWYLVRIPFKIAGHYFHVSPFSLPVRGWIIQQICKLGVFDVIGDSYDAVFNIDSETVLMKPLDLSKWINGKGEYMLFRDIKDDEPSRSDYCSAAKKLLGIKDTDIHEATKWNYMNTPVCFVKENLQELLKKIDNQSFLGGWKRTLCNTYRFSEYYTYGIFSDFFLKHKNHFYTDKHFFPQIDVSWFENEADFSNKVSELMKQESTMGIWLQKGGRIANSKSYLDHKIIEKVIKSNWKND